MILAPHLVGPAQEGPRPAALRRGHRPPAPRRHVLARRGRALQRRQRLQGHGCRDARGVMVTIIADNYFGYCKKEVKTQISFAANLFGLCEEEHAGGAIAFPSYVLGQDFLAGAHRRRSSTPPSRRRMRAARRPRRARARRATRWTAATRTSSTCPEDAEFDVREGIVRWQHEGGDAASSRCAPATTYVLPSGYQVRLEKQPGGAAWRLVGTAARGHALPQALHRLGRRQVGDLQVASPTPCSSGAGLRARLPARHGPGGRDPEHGLLRHLPRAAARSGARRPPHPQPGALARLRHQAAHALRRVHRRVQRLAARRCRRPSASSSSA